MNTADICCLPAPWPQRQGRVSGSRGAPVQNMAWAGTLCPPRQQSQHKHVEEQPQLPPAARRAQHCPSPAGIDHRSQITDHSPCAEPSGETRAPSLSPGLSAHTGQGAKLTNTTYFGHLSFTLPKHSATFRLERV